MNEDIKIGLVSVMFLGVAAQWVAWRFRFPSIVLLLICGLFVGPLTGLIRPDELLGDVLGPLVSISVGLILFEGGLSLRLSELPGLSRVVLSLISIGLVVTWFFAAWAAYAIIGMDFPLAVLLGAILTVSGPTVIIPLLRDIKPKAQLSSILKWEGILIDPIGALVAVLVFEAILFGEFGNAPIHIAAGILKTIAIGGLEALLGFLLLRFLIKNYLIPDYLQNPLSLVVVIVAFVSADYFQHESGLLAVTLMGFLLANWGGIAIKSIVEFKENLQVLLIGALFVLLSARLNIEQLQIFGWESLLFLAVLVFIARPLAVFLSTLGSGLSIRERIFLSWVAPRGIVAAAVSSLFALQLVEKGFPEAEQLVSFTFLVIIGTGFLYGLTAKPLAKLLRIEQASPQGVLFLGAHRIVRTLAKKLQEEKFKVLLVDTNWTNVSLAKLEGLPTFYGNILSEDVLEELDLEGIGRLFALTPNDEANSLAALRFTEHFGRAEVYQLPHDNTQPGDPEKDHPKHLRGRFLFGPEEYYSLLEEQIRSGAVIKTIPIGEEFDMEDIESLYEELFIPLILISENGTFEVMTHDQPLKPKTGQKIIALVHSTKGGDEF